MDILPYQMNINIMSFIPRRIHPTSVIMRKEIDKCYSYYQGKRLNTPFEHDDMWDEHYYCMEILTPYKEQFELDKYCDCCCESWVDCQCMCKCGYDYKDCRARCEENHELILRKTEFSGYCDCCGEMWTDCRRACHRCHGE